MLESSDHADVFVPQPHRPTKVDGSDLDAPVVYPGEQLPGRPIDNDDPLHTTYNSGIEQDIRDELSDKTARGMAVAALTAADGAVRDELDGGSKSRAPQALILKQSLSGGLASGDSQAETTDVGVIADGNFDQGVTGIINAVPEQIVDSRQALLDKLQEYYSGNNITRPQGPREAVGLVESLLHEGCIEEALDLTDFVANSPDLNSTETVHARLVLKYGWNSEMTHRVIQAVYDSRYAGQAETATNITDRLLKAVGEYGFAVWPGDQGFLSANCIDSAIRTARRIDCEYADALLSVTDAAGTRYVESVRRDQLRSAERCYASIIRDVLSGYSSGYGPDMARQLLNIDMYPDAKPIVGKTVERLLGRAGFPILAGHLGFKGDVLEKAWATGYGDTDRNGQKYRGAITPEEYRTENINMIRNLETARKGAAGLLHEKLHLANFARLGANMLEDAVRLSAGEIDFSKRSGPVVLLVQNGLDHNGSSYALRQKHSVLARDIASAQGIVVPIELRDDSSARKVSQNLLALGLPEADLIIWDSHGGEDALRTSAAGAANGHHTAEEIRELGGLFKRLMRDDGKGLMYACKAGADPNAGPARIFVDALGLPVWSSPETTSVARLVIGIVDGRIGDVQVVFRRSSDRSVVDPVLIKPGR